MRIRKLDLIRYGHFTGKSLELPPGSPDLHLVVGSNEAGKSTALAGLGDFLFGIPMRSTLNFEHDYASMRLGAVLEAGDATIELRRRKGSRNTLLDGNDAAVRDGELALHPFLHGANREFFERMFSLDHVRLRKGGEEILDAKDEVGAMLFSAGSAVQDLRGRLRGLEEEAAELWAPRHSKKKQYFQAADRLKQAERELREHTVTAKQWKECEEELGRRRGRCAELESEVEGKEAELRKLARIRRVARFVRKKAEMDAAIQDLGPVANIPEGAREVLDKAQEKKRFANLRIADEAGKLEKAASELQAIVCDEGILRRGKDFELLKEQRIEVRAERIDLPKREAELEALKKKLQDQAGEFGWQDEDASSLASRIPGRAQCVAVRNLLTARNSRLATVKAAKAALHDAEARLRRVQRQIDEAGEVPDTGPLAALIAATQRDAADIGSRIREAERAAADAESESDRLLAQMRPNPGSVDAACSVPVPATESVRQAKDAWTDCEKRLAACRDRLRQARHDRDAKRADRDTILATEEPVSAEELKQLRERREIGWDLIRSKYVWEEAVFESDIIEFARRYDDLIPAYEEAVRAADSAADKRFDRAAATARLNAATRSVAAAERHLEQAEHEEREIEEEFAALKKGWRELWSAAPFEPGAPAEMLEWLETHAKLGASENRRKKALRDEAACREREAEAIQQVKRRLQEVGNDSAGLDGVGLNTVIEAASRAVAQFGDVQTKKLALESQLADASDSIAEKHEALSSAKGEESDWQDEWSQAVSGLRLDPAADPEAVGAQLEVLDEMRTTASKITDLRDGRVRKIRRDLAAFDENVSALVKATAPDLAEVASNDAAIELERRFQRQRKLRQDLEAKEIEVSKLEAGIQALQEDRDDAQEVIDHLLATAEADDVDALRREIDKVERRDQCEKQRADAIAVLTESGDGLSNEDLAAECEGVDLDQARTREENIRDDVKSIRAELDEARDRRRDAQDAFDRMGGGDAAAKAAGERQSAIADIRDIAARYVRARAAARVLRWAIERHCQEQQGPLLENAGRMFRSLTSESFESLAIDYDDQDGTALVGKRPGGARVPISGMSDGTMDQLYLALRVAALEQYLQRQEALPFVADDLFINFDDDRAAAGFRVLGHLAKSCQVIFFTHHEHLAEVAKAALETPPRILRLQ